VVIIAALAALAKKLAIQLAKKLIKDKAIKEGKKRFWTILTAIILIPFILLFLIITFIGGAFSLIACAVPFLDICEEGELTMVSVNEIKKASERGTELRINTNMEATIPGLNFKEYMLKTDLNSKSEEKQNADSKTGAILMPGQSMDINPAEWLSGDWQGMNEGLTLRLARLAKDNGRKMSITDGFRPREEQQRLYDGWMKGLPGFNYAAPPGNSDHEFGMAADVAGWAALITPAEIKSYGLCKPLFYAPGKKNENWHTVPCETVGLKAGTLVTVDGFGSNFVKGDSASELFVYWLAMKQVDSFGITDSEEEMKEEAKKGTNLGLTYKIASGMMSGNYSNPAIDRNKKDEYQLADYIDLARFEIQKCYLIGDTKIGFFENLLGSETPCADIDRLAGKQVVPTKYQGVIAQTVSVQVCLQFADDGTCEKEGEQKTVVYKTPKEIIYMYHNLSLFGSDETSDYREFIDMIIAELFEATLVGGFDALASMPDYIVPFEKGTYETTAKFGQKTDGDILKGIEATTSAINSGIYSTSSGEIVRADNTLVLIKHSTGYYSQYEGFSNKYLNAGTTISQGQLFASFKKDTKVKFSICKELIGKGTTSECENFQDPEGPPAMLAFSFQEDSKRIEELNKEWAKLIANVGKDPVFMPGFSPLSNLGSLSAKYETGEKFPGERAHLCVHNAFDVRGGMSCGSYQIATNTGTMRDYLSFLQRKYPQYFNQLSGVPLVIESYGPTWKRVWENDKTGFFHSQHDFILDSHYSPVLKSLQEKNNLDFTNRHPVLQDVIWSFAVHHRYDTSKIFKAAGVNNEMPDSEFIERVYNARMKYAPSLTPRFINEKQDALNRLR
jgi:hypothetical protein